MKLLIGSICLLVFVNISSQVYFDYHGEEDLEMRKLQPTRWLGLIQDTNQQFELIDSKSRRFKLEFTTNSEGISSVIATEIGDETREMFLPALKRVELLSFSASTNSKMIYVIQKVKNHIKDVPASRTLWYDFNSGGYSNEKVLQSLDHTSEIFTSILIRLNGKIERYTYYLQQLGDLLKYRIHIRLPNDVNGGKKDNHREKNLNMKFLVSRKERIPYQMIEYKKDKVLVFFQDYSYSDEYLDTAILLKSDYNNRRQMTIKYLDQKISKKKYVTKETQTESVTITTKSETTEPEPEITQTESEKTDTEPEKQTTEPENTAIETDTEAQPEASESVTNEPEATESEESTKNWKRMSTTRRKPKTISTEDYPTETSNGEY